MQLFRSFASDELYISSQTINDTYWATSTDSPII